MAQLDWTDVLNIGLPEVDKQHKHLISLSNSLIQAMLNGMGTTVLEEIFTELRAYTCYHFSDEERFMERIGYPQLAEQKEAHTKLTKDVNTFFEQLQSGTGVTPNEALDFINGWIIKHIMEMDSKIAAYAKKHKDI